MRPNRTRISLIGNCEETSNFTNGTVYFAGFLEIAATTRQSSGWDVFFSLLAASWHLGLPLSMQWLSNDSTIRNYTRSLWVLHVGSVAVRVRFALCHQPCNWCDSHLSKSYDLHIGIFTWIPEMIIWKNIIPFKSDCLGTCWVSMQGKVSVTKWRGCFDRGVCTIQNTQSLLWHVVRLELWCIFGSWPFSPLKPRVESCSTYQDGDVFQTSHGLVVTIQVQHHQYCKFLGHVMPGKSCNCQVSRNSPFANSQHWSTCPALLCTHCDASLVLPFPPFILKMEGPDCRSCQHGCKANLMLFSCYNFSTTN